MPQQTICPACGAPIEYSGHLDEVRCPFCSTLLKVTEDNGETHFQVLDQPNPQKEVLSTPVEGGGGDEASPSLFDQGAQVYSSTPDTFTPAPSARTDTFGDVPVAYPPVPQNVGVAGGSRVSRWVWIVIGVVLAACLLMACAAAALVAIFRNQSF